MLDELKGIVKHSLLYGIGNWLRPLLAFLMIPIIYGILGPDVTGDYSILVLSVEVIGLVFGGRVEAAVTRFYFDRKDKALARRVVATALALVLMVGTTLLVLGYLLAPTLSWLLFERREEMAFTREEYISFFHLVFFTLLLQLSSQVGAAYVRIKKKAFFFSMVSVVTLFLGLSLNILFVVVLEWGLLGVLWSSVLTNFFVFGVYTWGVLRDIRPTFSVPDAKDMLAYGLPLVPGSVAYFLITFGDNFFLNEFRTPAEIGIYGLAYKFGILVSYAVTKPFMEFWRVRVYELYAKGRVRLKQRRAVNYYSFCVIQVALLISLLIDEVIRVTRREYWDAASIVPLLALGYVFAGLRLVFELGIHMKKKTRYSSYVTVASLVVNVSMNLLLIPRHGIQGAAIATLVTFVFMGLLALWFSERIFPIRYNLHRIVQLLLVAGGLYALSHFLNIRGWYKSVVMDLLLGFSFPIVLLMVGFYRPEERRIAGQAMTGILAWIRKKRPRGTRFETR